uniref:Immunodominant membrane protein n=1 Tax=Alder yellows phytoplasma TaxID=72989 RepID=A0A7U0TEF4_ALDYE|nr:immunodominant membrane protein [Alder yellows phytoplasma]
MQQKENFLKTKKGKIVVGSVGSVVGVLVLYLIVAYIISMWPFAAKITEKDLATFKTDVEKLVADEKAGSKTENDTTAKKVEERIEEVKKLVDKVNEKRASDKKIDTKKIEDLKTEAGKLKDKEKEAFKTVAAEFKTKVGSFVTSFKEDIKEK